MVEGGSACVGEAVLSLPFSAGWVVGAQRASLGLFQAHQFHGSSLSTDRQRGILLPTHHTWAWRNKRVTLSFFVVFFFVFTPNQMSSTFTFGSMDFFLYLLLVSLGQHHY